MGMTDIGNVDVSDVAQVYLGNATADDGDLMAGVRPDDVVPERERGIDTSEYRSPIEAYLCSVLLAKITRRIGQSIV